MTKIFLISLISLLSCNKSTINNYNDLDFLFNDFILLNSNKYDFNKIRYVSINKNSESFINWTNESGIDRKMLNKTLKSNKFNFKNVLEKEIPVYLKQFYEFENSKYDSIKNEIPNYRFKDFYVENYNSGETLNINYIILNESKNIAIISYGFDFEYGFIECYKKNNNKWIFHKELSRYSL